MEEKKEKPGDFIFYTGGIEEVIPVERNKKKETILLPNDLWLKVNDIQRVSFY